MDETLGDATSGKRSPPPYKGNAVLSTAQHVMDEVLKDRMRVETRRVLVKQLAEAETIEMKDNNKVCVGKEAFIYIHVVYFCNTFQLLRRCFNTWLDVVHDARTAQDKAHTTWVWRTKCRVFQAWRGLVEQHRRQQEVANLALQLQWEKRYESLFLPCVLLVLTNYHMVVVVKCQEYFEYRYGVMKAWLSIISSNCYKMMYMTT